MAAEHRLCILTVMVGAVQSGHNVPAMSEPINQNKPFSLNESFSGICYRHSGLTNTAEHRNDAIALRAWLASYAEAGCLASGESVKPKRAKVSRSQL